MGSDACMYSSFCIRTTNFLFGLHTGGLILSVPHLYFRAARGGEGGERRRGGRRHGGEGTV